MLSSSEPYFRSKSIDRYFLGSFIWNFLQEENAVLYSSRPQRTAVFFSAKFLGYISIIDREIYTEYTK